MNQQSATKIQLIQAAIGFGIILALTHLLDNTALVSDLSRQLIVAIMQIAGGTATDLGDSIVINQITIVLDSGLFWDQCMAITLDHHALGSAATSL